MAKFLSDSASGTVSVVARLHNTGKEALKGPLVACVTLLTTSAAEGVLVANSDNSQAGVGAEWLFAADAGLRPGERTEPKRFVFQLRGTLDFIPDKMKPNGFVDLGLQVLASGHPIKVSFITEPDIELPPVAKGLDASTEIRVRLLT